MKSQTKSTLAAIIIAVILLFFFGLLISCSVQKLEASHYHLHNNTQALIIYDCYTKNGKDFITFKSPAGIKHYSLKTRMSLPDTIPNNLTYNNIYWLVKFK